MNSLTGSLPLARLAARRDRIMLPAWIYVLAVLMVSTGYSFKKLYKTPQSREAVYSGIVHDPTVLALGGPLYGSSVGALTVYKYGAISALAAGLMSIFIVIRHTRADEESGRLELIGSTAVGRRAPLAVGVLLGAAANCVLALLMGAGLAAIGLPAGGAFAIGLAVGYVWPGLRRRRGGHGTAFRERPWRAGDSDLRARRVLPGHVRRGGGRFARRDALAALGLPDRLGDPGPGLCRGSLGGARAARGLRHGGDRGRRGARGPARPRNRPAAGPAGSGHRQPRGCAARSPSSGGSSGPALAGWAVGALVAGAAFGSIAGNIGSLLGSGTGLRSAVARLGGQSGLTDAYLAATMGIMGLAAAGYAISVVLRLRSDETAGRADPVLAAAVGRMRWAPAP